MVLWSRFFNRLGALLTAVNILFLVFIVWQLGKEAHSCSTVNTGVAHPVLPPPMPTLPPPGGRDGEAAISADGRIKLRGYAAMNEQDRPTCDVLLRHLSFLPNLPVYALSGYFRSGNSWTRHLLQRATGVVTGSIYNHAPLQRTGLWAEGVIEDTLITKTHAQNTTLFMYSDMLLIRQDRKPAVPIKFFPSKGSIHLIRNPFDSIYSWFQYRSTGEHFLTAAEMNVDQWETHIVREVDEWITDTKYWMHVQETQPDYKMMIVRYEDLHTDTEGLLRRMLDFIEWTDVDEYRISCALNVTKCEKMTYNCRSGRAGLASLHAYSNVQREWMLQRLRPYLEHYGYPTELPMNSTHDYVIGIRTPGTNLPMFCRKSSAFVKSCDAAIKRNAVPPKEKAKRPLRLYEKPVVLIWNAPLWPQWHKSGQFVNQWNQLPMDKPPSKCEWTTNRGAAPYASAVLFSGAPHIVNEHRREWCNKEYSMPTTKPFGQRWARFDTDSAFIVPILAVSEFVSMFDWTVGVKRDSTLRISFLCPFPTHRTYRDPPPPKKPGNVVIYVQSRCDAWARDELVKEMMDGVAITSVGKCVQNAEIEGDTTGSTPRRIDLKLQEIGTFKFYLAFESYNETDLVSEKIFHAFIAGVVPVYMGADNIDDFLPGPHSVIKAADFPDPVTLGKYLAYLDTNDEEYRAFFKWKEQPLSDKFAAYERLCAMHQGERFCEMVIDAQAQAREAFEKDPSLYLADDAADTEEEVTVAPKRPPKPEEVDILPGMGPADVGKEEATHDDDAVTTPPPHTTTPPVTAELDPEADARAALAAHHSTKKGHKTVAATAAPTRRAAPDDALPDLAALRDAPVYTYETSNKATTQPPPPPPPSKKIVRKPPSAAKPADAVYYDQPQDPAQHRPQPQEP